MSFGTWGPKGGVPRGSTARTGPKYAFSFLGFKPGFLCFQQVNLKPASEPNPEPTSRL
jgi:hypothetical protein